MVQYDVELPQVRARRPYQSAVVRNLSPLRRVVPVRAGEPLGHFVAHSNHFPPHGLEVLGLRHEADVGLAEVVAVGGVAELLEGGEDVVLVTGQLPEQLHSVNHRVEPLPQGLELGREQEHERDELAEHVAAAYIKNLRIKSNG